MPPSAQEGDYKERLIKTDPHELSVQGGGSGGGKVQEARKAKEMTNLLRIAAVAEIDMELGSRLIEVVVVLFLILIR
jgi:hypothetical protein